MSASNPGDDEDFDPPTGAALRLELRYLRRDLASLAQVIERGFDKVSADNATLERRVRVLEDARLTFRTQTHTLAWILTGAGTAIVTLVEIGLHVFWK